MTRPTPAAQALVAAAERRLAAWKERQREAEEAREKALRDPDDERRKHLWRT